MASYLQWLVEAKCQFKQFNRVKSLIPIRNNNCSLTEETYSVFGFQFGMAQTYI